jgi:hypothetical protein
MKLPPSFKAPWSPHDRQSGGAGQHARAAHPPTRLPARPPCPPPHRGQVGGVRRDEAEADKRENRGVEPASGADRRHEVLRALGGHSMRSWMPCMATAGARGAGF